MKETESATGGKSRLEERHQEWHQEVQPESSTMADYYSQIPLKFRGRTYILFRRTNSEDANFYIRIQQQGKRALKSLETPHRDLAKTRAKNWISGKLDGKWEALEAVKAKRSVVAVSTIGEAISAYTEGEEVVRAQTVANNVRCLRRLLSFSLSDIETKPLSVLTEGVVKAYQAHCQGRESVSYQVVLAANTTANSTYRQAKSVFSKRALKKMSHLQLPDLAGFMGCQFLKEPSHRYSDDPISHETIAAINAAVPALRQKDERLWVIHMMIRLMGMRDSEILHARRHWMVERNTTEGNRWYLGVRIREDEKAPKQSEGEIPIPAELLDYFKSQADYLIPASSHTERKNLIERTHSQWLRQFLPDRTKTNHELRKHAGSIVATKTNSFEQAAKFLRIDIETAKNHYLALLKPMEPLSAADIGIF